MFGDTKKITFDLADVPAAVISPEESAPSQFLHTIDSDGPHVVLPDGRVIARQRSDNEYAAFCNGTARLIAQQNNGLFFPEKGTFKFLDFISALKILRTEEDMHPELKEKQRILFENPDSWKGLETEAGYIPLVMPSWYSDDSFHEGHPVRMTSGLVGKIAYETNNDLHSANLFLVIHPYFGMANLDIVGRAITKSFSYVSREDMNLINEYLKMAEGNIQKRYREYGFEVKQSSKFNSDSKYGELEVCLLSNDANMCFSFKDKGIYARGRGTREPSFEGVASTELMITVGETLVRNIEKIKKALSEESENQAKNHVKEILGKPDKSVSDNFL